MHKKLLHSLIWAFQQLHLRNVLRISTVKYLHTNEMRWVRGGLPARRRPSTLLGFRNTCSWQWWLLGQRSRSGPTHRVPSLSLGRDAGASVLWLGDICDVVSSTVLRPSGLIRTTCALQLPERMHMFSDFSCSWMLMAVVDWSDSINCQLVVHLILK